MTAGLFAEVTQIRKFAMRAGLKPPPRLSLSAWADEHFRLSAESAATPGRWTTIPYQRGIMDAITDPAVEQVSVIKSARVGYTLMVSAAVGYYMHHAPCSILFVQPTVDDAQGFSKETIAPMLRDVPVLSRIVFDDAKEMGPKDTGNTILHKRFPGGVLSMVGANSGSGFRRVSRKVVIFDEVDGYPPSAGSDGDPIKLGIMRTQAFWDRKIISGSTPLVAGASRIEKLFEEGDGQRYYVPCPTCGHMAPLVFSGSHGHAMTWPDGKPKDAFFACQKNGCIIEHKDKRAMIEAGEWRAARENKKHKSFHIWAAYSYADKAAWGVLAEEFVKVKDDPEQLKTYVNTVLGETWKERGEAPEWERIYQRREPYGLGTVPAGVLVLTCGVDVQKDRFIYEVVGWGANKESWSIDAGVIAADTSNEAEWTRLDELISRTYPTEDGGMASVNLLAVDSGYNTNTVYNWARRHPMSRVIATKGISTARALISTPSPVDVTVRGKRMARGYKVWTVGVDMAKSELYGWLRLPMPVDAEPYPPGYCHFPEHGPDYFKQLTGEHLVSHADKHGFTRHEWELIPGRENHFLDCRVYARAAAALLGLDRMAPPQRATRLPLPAPVPTDAALREDGRVRATLTPTSPSRKPGSFLARGDKLRGRGKRWLK